MALWKYFKREVKTPLLSPTGSLYSAISSGGTVATNKEVQCVVETINDGTLLKRGPYEMRKGRKLVDTLLSTE